MGTRLSFISLCFPSFFAPTVSPDTLFHSSSDFDESVRVDRGASGGDPAAKRALVEQYHVTDPAARYLKDLFARLVGETEGKRKGANHWLYGFYGSGKSHLLAVTGLLLDSKWVESKGRDAIWDTLVGATDRPDLRELWERCLGEYELRPLFINLLKEQGNEQRGFGNVILRRLHEEQGYSPHLPVAFFEQWYRENNPEADLSAKAGRVLEDEGVGVSNGNVWERVQKYQVLADGVMPALFEEATGTQEGLKDVTERTLNASAVAQRIEQARQRMEDESGRPVRLLLLLDEITLFIGTNYGLLTELNALAEAIDEVGDGKILTVGTAQEDPSRVQTEYAAREVDFSILADRFPNQYSLPSSHVGDIVRNRLLRKTEQGQQAFETALSEADLTPGDSLVFYDVQQNTDPPLDDISREEAAAYLPLLPYQPPLFLNILSQLRTKEANRAKSIFSGTARAVLAIVDGLLDRWAASPEERKGGKGADPSRIVSLVDFFEVIRPELEDIVPQEVKTIKEVEEDDQLKEFDEKVCKVVLLLQRIPDMIPLDDPKNIAVGLMDDLNGRTLHGMANAVDDSLGRLGKYIRADEEEASHRRFTNREERILLEDAEEREEEFGPNDIVDEMTAPAGAGETHGPGSLWAEVLEHLDVPRRVPFRKEGDLYPVQYRFSIDGHSFEADFGEEGALRAEIYVEGLVSDEDRPPSEHGEVFLWKLSQDGREALYRDLKRWAALSAACREHVTPETIERTLRRRREDLPSRIAARIQNGELIVPEQGPSTVTDGVVQYIRKTAPSAFHPEMLLVDEDRLRELEGVRWTAGLPQWAEKIGVVCDTQTDLTGDIVTTVRGIVGRTIKQEGELSIQNALGRLQEEEDIYEQTGPALVAHLWGLSRRGTFQPRSEDGSPQGADELLDPSRWHELRLRLGQDASLRPTLEQVPSVDQNDTLNEAVVKTRDFIDDQRRRADTLRQQIKAAEEDAATEPVKRLLERLAGWLKERRDQLKRWLDKIRDRQSDDGQQIKWESVIQSTLETQAQIGAAKTQWASRESYLLQLDGLLLLRNQREEAVDDETVRALDTLYEEARAATPTLWWTDDGWTEFVDRLGHHGEAVRALRDWWDGVRHSEALEELLEKVEGNPWLASPLDLPKHIGVSFRSECLDPIRTLRSSIERTEDTLRPLVQEAHEVAPSDVRQALGRLQRGTDLAVPTDETARQHLRRLRALEALTEGAGPDDVMGLGYWQNDHEDLADPLRRLAREDADLTFEDTEHGVRIEPSR